jgi:hypothetical protein
MDVSPFCAAKRLADKGYDVCLTPVYKSRREQWGRTVNQGVQAQESQESSKDLTNMTDWL